jgi:hypothetical protein
MLATGKLKAVEIRSQNLDTVEVHVQDADAAVLLSLSWTAGMMASRVRSAL